MCLILIAGNSSAEIALSPDLQRQVDAVRSRTVAFKNVKNVQYGQADGVALRGDLLLPEKGKEKRPGVLVIHGGGWCKGSRRWGNVRRWSEAYARMGFVVLNIDYRLAETAPAPAAVEDVKCAVRFMHAHAGEWGMDSSRIVVTGGSAGGHLALMAGLCNDPAFSNKGGWEGWPEAVAAVVNRYGITDVLDVLQGSNARGWARAWLPPELPDSEELVKRLSPLSYTVLPNRPPVFTVHGAEDSVVPPEHALRLHLELLKNRNSSELFVVPFADHGLLHFRREELRDCLLDEVDIQITAFLIRQGILCPEPAATAH